MTGTIPAMRLIRSALAGLLALSAVATATAQTFPTVPDKTVIGRIGIGGQSGPSQAIPFATLFSNIVSASGVPNAVLGTDASGNGRFSATLPSGLTIPSPTLTGSVSSPFGANLPLFGGGSGSPIVAGTATGNTTKVATGSGSYVATNCIQSDANHNLVDAGAPCGTGTTVANAQDFIAGTGFTAGTTTALTVSATPITKASTAVYFDGRLQSDNTWTLSGSTVTFSAAIPSTIQVVEIKSLSATVLPTWVTSIGGAQGAILLGGGITLSGQTLNAAGGSLDNFLPNVQWQLWSSTQFTTKQNAAGTASQPVVACTAYSTSVANPIFTCPNTGQVKVGDLIITSNPGFWVFPGVTVDCTKVQCTQGAVTSARVTAVVANTSLTLASPGLGGTSQPSSTSLNLTVVSPGELGLGNTAGADGWTKTGTLVDSVDDFGASATPASTVYPGCIRPLLLRKGITGQEIFQYSIPTLQLPRFRGRTVTFGAAVYQRVQGGASTWNLHIDDSSGTSTSGNGTGVSLGGYQFLSVTRTIAQNATGISIYINLLGNAGDVFDVCLPTAAFAPSMVESQLKQNSGERIRATGHWNPPLLTPFIVQFPSVEMVPGSGLYGWNGNDLEAMSMGTVHNTVSYARAKLEWTTSSPGAIIFTGTTASATTPLTFGPQAGTQVANITLSTPPADLPLFHDGTFAIFTNNIGLVTGGGGKGCTFDFDDVTNTGANGLN